METEKFAKQMIGFQKAAFDNTFDALVMFQDHSQKLFETTLEQTNWLPDEGRRVIDEWISACKKGRIDLKEIIDENFVKWADLFTVTPKKETQAPQPVKAK